MTASTQDMDGRQATLRRSVARAQIAPYGLDAAVDVVELAVDPVEGRVDLIQFGVELGDPLLRLGVKVVLHTATSQKQGPVHRTYGRGPDRRRVLEVLDRDAREPHVGAHDDGDYAVGDDGRIR